ncbi:MAG: hypothetical protein M1832_004349 [Thelocarpon impressellum]|nr:MAG: hypothetical protein M1832_004349 [Thelocarpon impressellum]
MILRTRLAPLFLAMCALFALSHASPPTRFCKCTCFSNSTIIPLGGQPPPSSHDAPTQHPPRTPSTGDGGKGSEKKKESGGSCASCNRQFCLAYNLPICKGAAETDVFTTCFQRDSRKDEAVVFVFIAATVGLLAYAAAGPWLRRWREAAEERRLYVPLPPPAEEAEAARPSGEEL